MKISILSPNLSLNSLSRVHTLAKILQKQYDIEIVGPIFNKEIWEPLKHDETIIYKTVRFSKDFRQLWQLWKLYKKIDGDLIYASKPLFTSFGIGLIKKFFTNKKLILDIDDWEIGFKKNKYYNANFLIKVKYFFKSIRKDYKKSSSWFISILEKSIRLADKITVSSTFLQKRFGGTLVWHGRDEKCFNPKKYSKSIIRKKYNIKYNDKIIMFLGTPRKHKGIEEIIESISEIKDEKVKFVLVGANEKGYCKKLLKFAERKIPGKIISYGMQSFQNIPEFLSFADIIVIPQRDNYSSIGQVPAKLFDSMAMAKAIIATDVSDISKILGDCGLVIEPGNQEKLKRAINSLLCNQEEVNKLGKKARERFKNKYNWENLKKVLIEVVEDVKKTT